MTSPVAQPNRTKVRIGLGLISTIFVGSIVLLVVTNDPLGRAMMAGVAFVCFVRIALLVRWIRSQRVDGLAA